MHIGICVLQHLENACKKNYQDGHTKDILLFLKHYAIVELKNKSETIFLDILGSKNTKLKYLSVFL